MRETANVIKGSALHYSCAGVNMVKTSQRAGTLAEEVFRRFGTPTLVFRGQVFEVDVGEAEVITVRFLGYVGTGASFTVFSDGDGGFNICDVRVIEEPRVNYGKLVKAGMLEIITCSEHQSQA